MLGLLAWFRTLWLCGPYTHRQSMKPEVTQTAIARATGRECGVSRLCLSECRQGRADPDLPRQVARTG